MKLIFETEYAETQHTKTVFVSFHSLSIGCKSFFFLHVEMVEKIGMFAFKSVCLYFRFSISFRISDLVAVFLLLLFTLNASLMCAVFFLVLFIVSGTRSQVIVNNILLIHCWVLAKGATIKKRASFVHSTHKHTLTVQYGLWACVCVLVRNICACCRRILGDDIYYEKTSYGAV